MTSHHSYGWMTVRSDAMVLRLALILCIQVGHEILNNSIETDFLELSVLLFPLVYLRNCWADALHWGTSPVCCTLSTTLFTNCVFTAVHSEQLQDSLGKVTSPVRIYMMNSLSFSFFLFPPLAKIMNENVYWAVTAPLKANIPMMMGKVSFVIRFTETIN